jgi:ribosomal protein S18 acetylase RimI-like enzyme
MTPRPVRTATGADVEAISAALARAFDDDPVMTWFFPHEARRRRRLPRFMAAMTRIAALPHGAVYTTDGHDGAALWSPPGTWKTTLTGQMRLAPAMVGLLGARLPLALRTFALIEKGHPEEPHWYLMTLGTDPPSQGKGIGSALMAPVLDRCDREGIPAYLESSKESNIAFYRRHGFEVTRQVDLPGGPSMWPMWRDPR